MNQNPETPSAVPDVKEEEKRLAWEEASKCWDAIRANAKELKGESIYLHFDTGISFIQDAILRVLEKKEAVAESVAEKNLEEPRAVSGLRDVQGPTELRRKIRDWALSLPEHPQWAWLRAEMLDVANAPSVPEGPKSDSATGASSEILQHTCPICEGICHGTEYHKSPSSSANAQPMEERFRTAMLRIIHARDFGEAYDIAHAELDALASLIKQPAAE